MAECIEREATIKRIKEVYCVGCNSYNGVRCRACGTGDAIDIIEDAPTVDAVPVVHGEWIHHDDGVVTCSECGNAESSDSYYCRYCGAKMDGGTDNGA